MVIAHDRSYRWLAGGRVRWDVEYAPIHRRLWQLPPRALDWWPAHHPAHSMPLRAFLLMMCLFLMACSRQPEPVTSASVGATEPPPAQVQRKPQAEIDWSQVHLEAGDAWLSCSPDYGQGDGRPVLSLAYEDMVKVAQTCREVGLLRLRYKGKVTASFGALVERLGRVAGDLGIGKRILDIDSTGGHVEAAMRAGDAIGENDWTIWVRGDSRCHSSCVLLLAAGDMRVIAGPVGIHRMLRIGSSATSRKELGDELRKVSEDLRNYLERNGASHEVYDLMTTVPNRTLRILTSEELDRMGLSGVNAVEDDLNRIRLARRCGLGFVQRRDAFRIAYEARCRKQVDGEEPDIDQINQCGLDLRSRFGFPDEKCPDESPMAELDGAILMPNVVQIPDLELPPETEPVPVKPVSKPKASPTKPAAGPAASDDAPEETPEKTSEPEPENPPEAAAPEHASETAPPALDVLG
ncbi:MAG: hypothetical protein QM612_00010 [Thermomonas sp.]|uniref:hypothetical protein n=1 Tax=Thermomonas sp. TaxID=1971895 RepID=UPI0039E61CEF